MRGGGARKGVSGGQPSCHAWRAALRERRKKKLPRSGTRRLQRQWYCAADFAGCRSPRAAFPSVDDWHLVLGITAGMDQKDCIAVVVLAAACAWLVLLVLLLALCSFTLSSGPRCAASRQVWIRSTVMSVPGWFAGDPAPRAVFLSLSSGPRCAASWPVWIRGTVFSVLGWWLVTLHLALCFFPVVMPKMLRILAGTHQTVARGVQENWIIWETTTWTFDPSYMTVTCSVFALGVRVYGFSGRWHPG